MKKICGTILVCLMAICGAIFCKTSTTETVSAANYCYNTYGITKWVSSSFVFFKSSGSQKGCPNQFQIQMYEDATAKTESLIDQNSYVNWSYYFISVKARDIAHNSFELRKDGKPYHSKNISGNKSQTLFQGKLGDGNYTLVYTGICKRLPFYICGYTYTYSFTVDTKKPQTELLAGGKALPSGAHTSLQTDFRVKDTNFSKLYYKSPTSAQFETSSEPSYTVTPTEKNSGLWEFYAEDNAGNRSENYKFVMDIERPQVYCISDGERTLKDSFHVPFSVCAEDAGELEKLLYQCPGSKLWQVYDGSEICGAQGEYRFQAFDRAGNASEILTVYYDLEEPLLTFKAEGKLLSCNYTNADYFQCLAEDTISGLAELVVRLPSQEEEVYLNGSPLTEEGEYVFYAEDRAGNRTAEYKVILCKTLVSPRLKNVTDGKTDGNFSVVWSDSSQERLAPIVVATVNDIPYANGSEIATVEGGIYCVRLEDAAGNVWSSEIVSERKNILTQTVIPKWWETCDKYGTSFAFESYEKALSFAADREFIGVEKDFWSSEQGWDKGIPMDAKDSAYAAHGSFYIYKAQDNPNQRVAYFTDRRLREVLYEYAVQSVTSYYFWEKDPSPARWGNDIYISNRESTVVADAVSVTGDTWVTTSDGRRFKTSKFAESGNHEVKISDDFGNSYAYTFIVLNSAPEIRYSTGNESDCRALNNQIYFHMPVSIQIKDDYDSDAMFLIKDSHGETIRILSIGERYEMSEPGCCIVQAVNRFGFSEQVTFYLSMRPAEVKFYEDTDKKELIVTALGSSDEYAEFTNLVIEKSLDNGESWKILTQDDFGQKISVHRTHYRFVTSGIYRVHLEDVFRNGFEAIIAEYEYVQKQPEGNLEGVNEYGYSNTTVRYVTQDSVEFRLKKNGNLIAYAGEYLQEEGQYELTVFNQNGDKLFYQFYIDKTAPEITDYGLDPEDNGSGEVKFVWNEQAIGRLIKNDNYESVYESGQIITEIGAYVLEVRDLAGNLTSCSFQILGNYGFWVSVWDGCVTNESVTVYPGEEELILLQNGNVVAWSKDDIISAEGKYVLKTTDGQKEVYSFEIIRKARKAYTFLPKDGVQLLSVLYNGNTVEKIGLSFSAEQEGVYQFEIGNGIQSNIFQVVIDLTPPSAVMDVENGGRTDSSVRITDLSEEAKLTAFCNNERINYQVGQTLNQPGYYRVVLEDEAGNRSEYTFEIYFAYNAGSVILFVLLIAVVIAVAVYVIKLRKSYKNK